MFIDMFGDDVFLDRIKQANNLDLDTLDVIMLSLNREQLGKYLDSIEDLDEYQKAFDTLKNINNLASKFVKKSAEKFNKYSTREVSGRISGIG